MRESTVNLESCVRHFRSAKGFQQAARIAPKAASEPLYCKNVQ